MNKNIPMFGSGSFFFESLASEKHFWEDVKRRGQHTVHEKPQQKESQKLLDTRLMWSRVMQLRKVNASPVLKLPANVKDSTGPGEGGRHLFKQGIEPKHQRRRREQY